MPISDYLAEIQKALQSGDATEHTHRPALQSLFSTLGPKLTIINEPKRSTDCGAPDIVVKSGKGAGSAPIGYIECKDVGKSLDDALRTDQLKRYLASLQSLVLTDYLEFRWYVDGDLRDKASLGNRTPKNKVRVEPGGDKQVLDLLKAFFAQAPLRVGRASELAERMANITHMIRVIVVRAFKQGLASETLSDLREAFAQTIMPELDLPDRTNEFADMYAQTLAYGLFAARVNHNDSDGPFRRDSAAREIPPFNPFLRKLFDSLTGTALDDEPHRGFVDDLVALLGRANMRAVLEDFGSVAWRRDPVVHFYETFLQKYDPELRELRGVYFTPEPVVSYIVRSVDTILKDRFACANGLADTSRVPPGASDTPTEDTSHKVLILDPACGTGSFLYWVVELIRDRFRKSKQGGKWAGYVRQDLLPRLFGFELLMAPYAVAHFKLAMQLAAEDQPELLRKAWSYEFGKGERLGIYLSNTLEEAKTAIPTGFLGAWKAIAEEAVEADAIKKDKPILVVMGNPPYSGHSANRSEEEVRVQKKTNYIKGWEPNPDGGAQPIFAEARRDRAMKQPTFIGRLIRDYYFCAGEPLGEKNPKWLQDDYVKFIRWAQWRIDVTGSGVLAFITNHRYLGNPTFSGMRRSLMNSFNDIYVLDLHGNARSKEKTPEGEPDQNVFDIQQGVAIGIFIKEPGVHEPCRVWHADIWGNRNAKYDWLMEHDAYSTSWQQVEVQKPQYLFLPSGGPLAHEYKNGWSIPDLFEAGSLGIATARDNFTIDWSAKETWGRVVEFISLETEEARNKFELGKDVRDWKVKLAQKDVSNSGPDKAKIASILYRPFDIRSTYYTGKSRGFHCMPRREVMSHMLAGKNLGLSTTRSIEIGRGWEHVLCSRWLTQLHTVSLKEVNYLFPLYKYADTADGQDEPGGEIPMPWLLPDKAQEPNFNDKFLAELKECLHLEFIPDGPGDLEKTFGPEDIFSYMYAILHSPTYRERYSEFLKHDFPRIPLSREKRLFTSLCRLGSELVAHHLLEHPSLDLFEVEFPISGSQEVAKSYPKYVSPGIIYLDNISDHRGRIFINNKQYFEGVNQEVWEFSIGGYQVCHKWLKDRKGHHLSLDEIETYQKIIKVLGETIRLMSEVDKVIDDNGGWPIG